MFGSQPLPVSGGLVLKSDGTRVNTGGTPTTAQKILKLGAQISGCCDVRTLWVREFEDLPGFGRLCVQLIFDDSCLLKNLPPNPFVRDLAGDVILSCTLDVYKLDESSCCEDETLCSLPVLEVFNQKSIGALLKAGPSSNQLELPFDRQRVKAGFQQASIRKWGKVYAVGGNDDKQEETAEADSAEADSAEAREGSTRTTAASAPPKQYLTPTQKRRQRKAKSNFAANLQKAFGS